MTENEMPDDGAVRRTLLNALDLPDDLRMVFNYVLRERGSTAEHVSAALNMALDQTDAALLELVELAYLEAYHNEPESAVVYKPKLAKRPSRRIASDLWSALDNSESNS